MRIYTGRGDAGETDLRTGDRVSKADARIEAYGTVDEANAAVGLARAATDDVGLEERLAAVQNDLHAVQAMLACPGDDDERVTVDDEAVDRLEAAIDQWDEELPPLDSFILPGGSETAARLHRARSTARRAERRTVALADRDGDVADAVLAYLNRLSDFLFAAARVANHRGDVEEPSPDY